MGAVWGSGSVFHPTIRPTEKAVRGALLHGLAPSKRQVLSPNTHRWTSRAAFLSLRSCCLSAPNALPHSLCKESPGISTPSSLQTSFGPRLMYSEYTVSDTLASLSLLLSLYCGRLSPELPSSPLGTCGGQASSHLNLHRGCQKYIHTFKKGKLLKL